MEKRYGLIDIGSNTIRLVIYEKTDSGAHRVIDGSKRSARLSEHINSDGALSDEGIALLVATLDHFLMLCDHHKLHSLTALATAAIRNATNQSLILEQVEQATNLRIDLLSGIEEAELGFIGMINSIPIKDGFLVDIGGGSTEITLFQQQQIISTYSFPFGCVNMSNKYKSTQMSEEQQFKLIKTEVLQALEKLPWLHSNAGYPLVGVGGTLRSLGKIDQATHAYPLDQTHNYELSTERVHHLINYLADQPTEKRKKVLGLSKERVDVILPGLAIVTAVFEHIQATHYIICGAGLRDGLFYTMFNPGESFISNPLQYSVNNLLKLHTAIPYEHANRVKQYASELLHTLHQYSPCYDKEQSYLFAAALLYRVGASIDYYNYSKHTFYLIIHSHLNGISHRELILIAAIASYRSKNKNKNTIRPYQQLLLETDEELINKLGTLLQLAIALDRSESQAIEQLSIHIDDHNLLLQAQGIESKLQLEIHAVQDIAPDINKYWKVTPQFQMIHK